jgi:hypothetical protein
VPIISRLYQPQRLWGSPPPAVQFDAVGVGGFTSSNVLGTNSATVTFNHTAAANAGCVACLQTSGNAVPTVTVTYNAVSMTLLKSVVYNNPDGFVQIYGLASVPSGTSSVVATSNFGTQGLSLLANSLSFTHVNGFGAGATNTATSTSLSLAVPSSRGQMIAQIFGNFANSISAYNQTSEYAQNNWVGTQSTVIGIAKGAGSVSFTGTGSSSALWSAVGVQIY